MSYTKQSWVAPTGTGLNRYAKGTETETHITLTLDPESLTNTPTPFTVARMAHMEDGIVEAHAIENVYPIEWQEYALGQTSRSWYGMTTLGTDVYACVDIGDIYKQTGGTGDFVALGQTSRLWNGMTSNGTDVYACVNSGDIYKQTGGTGDFVALNQTTRLWRCMTSNGTDVYACVINGDIYKQTGGTGDFVALNQTSRKWIGMTSNGTDVYACVDLGDIYKQTGGTGDFVALNQTSRKWIGMTSNGTDVYACVDIGDIYKQTGGTGDFVALNQTSRLWNGMTILGNVLYACVHSGDIYKLSLSNTIRASADFTLPTYTDGSRKRIANTHETNTITCTLPTGQTMNGQSSFTIIARKILELELIGSVWIDTNTDYYSTTEQIIGRWIDGKPLYRKVISLPFAKDVATSTTVGVANMGVQFIDLSSTYVVGTYGYRQPWDKADMYVEDGNLFATINHIGGTLVASICYTKTTD